MKKIKFSWKCLVIAAGIIALTGCMKAAPKPGEVFVCAKESQITKTIAPEAVLENFSCVIKPYEGTNTLHFSVGVKNISGQEQRFKVNIFLDNDKAVGGLLPEKTKGGLVKPGETAEFTYPVMGMNCGPGKIELIIKTMSQ